eukprot:Sspe_Gene.8997::Locus_3027_Transcript_1_1_Confidence_1.000_Length_1479::g.8997::m.8997
MWRGAIGRVAVAAAVPIALLVAGLVVLSHRASPSLAATSTPHTTVSTPSLSGDGYWCRPNVFTSSPPSTRLHCATADSVVYPNGTMAVPVRAGRGVGEGNMVSARLEFMLLLATNHQGAGSHILLSTPAEDVQHECRTAANWVFLGPPHGQGHFAGGPPHHLLEDTVTSMYMLYRWNSFRPVPSVNQPPLPLTYSALSDRLYFNIAYEAYPVCARRVAVGYGEHLMSRQDCPMLRNMRSFIYDTYGFPFRTLPYPQRPVLGFISRRGSQRQITNQAELMRIAEEMGFTVRDLELNTSSLAGVLELMREVTVLVGLHGGGMHTTRYLQDGTVFIHLNTYHMPPDFGWYYLRAATCTAGNVVEWLGPPSASGMTARGAEPAHFGMAHRQWLRSQSISVPIEEWRDLLHRAASLGCHSMVDGKVRWDSRGGACARSTFFTKTSADFSAQDPT